MIKLTDGAGNAVYIAKSWVQYVRKARADDYVSGTVHNAVVVMSGHEQAVQETVKTIVDLLGGLG